MVELCVHATVYLVLELQTVEVSYGTVTKHIEVHCSVCFSNGEVHNQAAASLGQFCKTYQKMSYLMK